MRYHEKNEKKKKKKKKKKRGVDSLLMCVDGRRKVLELILPGGRANDLAEGRVYNRGTRR